MFFIIEFKHYVTYFLGQEKMLYVFTNRVIAIYMLLTYFLKQKNCLKK